MPFVSWFCSISEYSLRMSLNSSSCSGMLICFLNSLMLVLLVDERELDKNRAVKVVQEVAPVLEDGRLVLVLGELDS